MDKLIKLEDVVDFIVNGTVGDEREIPFEQPQVAFMDGNLDLKMDESGNILSANIIVKSDQALNSDFSSLVDPQLPTDFLTSRGYIKVSVTKKANQGKLEILLTYRSRSINPAQSNFLAQTAYQSEEGLVSRFNVKEKDLDDERPDRNIGMEI